MLRSLERFDRLLVHFKLDIDFLIVCDERLFSILPNVLVQLKVRELTQVVVYNHVLEGGREVVLREPDATLLASPPKASHAIKPP